MDEKILEKLAKIKAHADSAEKIGSTEEAQTFAEMLQRLLLKHNLDMSDIEFAKHEVDEPVEKFSIDWEQYGLKTKKQRIDWEERLASIVADAHFCRILVSEHSNRIWLVGRKSNAAVAEYLIVTLRRAAKKIAYLALAEYQRDLKNKSQCLICGLNKDHHVWESHEFQREKITDHHGFKASFLAAFVNRIAERLKETRESVVTSNCTALVRINKDEAAVRDFMSQNYIGHAKMIRSRSGSNSEGFLRGRQAADAVNLKGNAMNQGSEIKSIKS